MRLAVLIVLGVFALIVIADNWAHAKDDGRYAQSDPSTRQWFRSQKSPRTGQSCCSEADGVYAEEDIRDGRYWTRFIVRGHQQDWMLVPDDVVIRDPNRNGAPVVWWRYQNGKLLIYCYAPGGGV